MPALAQRLADLETQKAEMLRRLDTLSSRRTLTRDLEKANPKECFGSPQAMVGQSGQRKK